MKRVYSLFLACTMLAAVTIQAEATTYNASNAIAYADKHWNDGKGLCAEFVSDCLAAGGVTIPDNPSYYSSSAPSYNNNSGSLGKYTNPYTCSASLLLYLSERYPVITDPSFSDIAVGDVVFMYSGEWRDGHVGIIISTDGGTPIYAAHNRATKTGRFYSNYPCTYVVKMGGALTVPTKPTITTTTAYYAEYSNITISWDPAPGNTFYWINVFRDGTLIVDQSMGSTTSYTIQSAAKGYYLVYVSANNSAGTSGSSEYTFSVIENAAPDIPVISASNEYCKTGASITVSWNPVENATSYIYYLAEFPTIYTYETNYMCETTTDTSVTFSNLPNGKYYMLVHAVNAFGVWGEQSNGVWLNFYNYDYVPVKSTVYNGHMYVLYDNTMSWDLAQALCEMEGGYLVTITSQKENEVVKSLISTGKIDGYWIGARNDNSGDYTVMGDSFRWVTGETFTYSDWREGEPSGGGDRATAEHFAEIRKSYGSTWNDVKHTTKNGFVLELDISNLVPASTAYYEHSKYILFDKNITWTEASEICKSLGGHLATISSIGEDTAISKLLKEGKRDWYYIGASKMSGTWEWVDGSDTPMSGGCANWMDTSGNSQPGPTGWGDYLMKYRETEGWIGIPNFYMPSSNMSQIGFVCEIDDAIVDYIPGDINDDGVVNTKDLTRLLKYLSHEDVSVNTYALDVNGDGAVNTKDLTRLLKYISHEDVKIY